MSKVDKTGDFSKRYNYVHCEDGEYYLLPKAKVPNAEVLKNRDLPEGKTRNQDIKFFSFDITVAKICVYVFVCFVFSVFLSKVSLYLVILLWSMNLHEFTHIGFASASGSDRLIFGVKIKYNIFFMLYISNRRIYEHSKKYRICYYAAGITTNLSISLLAWVVLYIPIGTVYSIVVQGILQVNIALFIFNLFPFLFTDGFNILQEILEVYNLREQTITNFFNPVAHAKRGPVAFTY